ncbi:MAG: hypothetical protein RL662_361 [Bacteroidota bacterium]|jgi:4-amino-4-deoxychorismate lyase
MNKPIFIETIKIVDGICQNIASNIARISRTTSRFYNTTISISKKEVENQIPEDLRNGVVKCRITYSSFVHTIEFEAYQLRKIKSLKLINGDCIDYTYKYANRDDLQKLLSKKEGSDEILIVQNGYVTDTSYSNVVFVNKQGLFTPSTFLLAGTKRNLLLETGIIKEVEIKVSDLDKYKGIYLINAMIDIDDDVYIEIENVKR